MGKKSCLWVIQLVFSLQLDHGIFYGDNEMKQFLLATPLLFGALNGQWCNNEISDIYISDKARSVYETKLAEAKTKFKKDPSVDNLIWLGRREAYLGNLSLIHI